MTFMYHMHGFHVNQLELFILRRKYDILPVWSQKGPQGKEWRRAMLEVNLKYHDKVSTRKTLFFHSFHSQRKIHESYLCLPQICHKYLTHLCKYPSRHRPDFHRPQSQITIDSPDFHPRRSQKCLLGTLKKCPRPQSNLPAPRP